MKLKSKNSTITLILPFALIKRSQEILAKENTNIREAIKGYLHMLVLSNEYVKIKDKENVK